MRLTKSTFFNFYSGHLALSLTFCYPAQSLSGVPRLTFPGRKEGTFAHESVQQKDDPQLTSTRLRVSFYYYRAIMIDRILRGDYVDMEGGNWDLVSDDAKAFVKSLLQLDPQQRPSAAEALESPWMQTKNDADVENLSLMNHDQKEQRAKRLAVLLVMEKASSDDILKLQRIVHRYDPEETGFIALSDLRKALKETGRFESSELDEVLPEMKVVSL